MRAQASYVGVRKTYCYHTDTRTKNLQFKGTVDEQNRHQIINRTTSLNPPAGHNIDSAQHGPHYSDMKQQKREMRMSVTNCTRIIAWHAEYEVTEYTSKGTTSALLIIEYRRKHGGKHGLCYTDSLMSFSLTFNQFRKVSQPLIGLPSCLCMQGFLVVSVRLGVDQDVSMLLTNTCTCTSANWSTLIPGTCTLQYNFVTNLAKEYTLSGSNPAIIYLPGPLPSRC